MSNFSNNNNTSHTPDNKLCKKTNNEYVWPQNSLFLNNSNIKLTNISDIHPISTNDTNITPDIPITKLLNYYPGVLSLYGNNKVNLSRIHVNGAGVCLYDFNSLSLPILHDQIVEGVIIVNLSDIIPKTILDALLTDYTVSHNRDNYKNVIKPFIESFALSHHELMTRLYALRLQHYCIVMHLDISSTVNFLFRRNSQYYNTISSTDINEIIIEKMNGFITELMNSMEFTFGDVFENTTTTDLSTSNIHRTYKNYVNILDDYYRKSPNNNAIMFNYIISTQKDSFSLTDTASLLYTLNMIKSHGKYTAPTFNNNIYLVGYGHSPDLNNLSSGINTNLMFMLANGHIAKTVYPISSNNTVIRSPIFININTLVTDYPRFIIAGDLARITSNQCVIPYMSNILHTLSSTARMLTINMKQQRMNIQKAYSSMLQSPNVNKDDDKYLLVGVNLDIEFDRYILEELEHIWQTTFISGNTEPKLRNPPRKLTNPFSFGSGIMSSGTVLGSSSKRNAPANDDISDFLKFLNNISSTSDMIIGTVSIKEGNVDKNNTDNNKHDSEQGIKYIHVPYGIKKNDYLDTDCLHNLYFNKIHGKRHINVLRGSALTFELFTDLANHIIHNNKYPSAIQARYFDFQINKTLRLALGYRAYLHLLYKILKKSDMPTVETSYLYFRYQQWCRWVKSSSDISSSDNKLLDANTCCQCCKCVSQRNIQYYTFGHLPILNNDLLKSIEWDTNPEFWTPRA